jgi:hypothetical protein
VKSHRAAEPPAGSAAASSALPAGALLLLAGLAAVLLMPGPSDLPDASLRGPVVIGDPGADPAVERARALALARGLDPLGQRLLQTLTLRPAASGPGLVIVDSSDAAMLDDAGLRVGDRLLESDQEVIGAADATLLARQFATMDAVEITLERDNRLRRMTLDLTR